MAYLLPPQELPQLVAFFFLGFMLPQLVPFFMLPQLVAFLLPHPVAFMEEPQLVPFFMPPQELPPQLVFWVWAFLPPQELPHPVPPWPAWVIPTGAAAMRPATLIPIKTFFSFSLFMATSFWALSPWGEDVFGLVL